MKWVSVSEKNENFYTCSHTHTFFVNDRCFQALFSDKHSNKRKQAEKLARQPNNSTSGREVRWATMATSKCSSSNNTTASGLQHCTTWPCQVTHYQSAWRILAGICTPTCESFKVKIKSKSALADNVYQCVCSFLPPFCRRSTQWNDRQESAISDKSSRWQVQPVACSCRFSIYSEIPVRGAHLATSHLWACWRPRLVVICKTPLKNF